MLQHRQLSILSVFFIETRAISLMRIVATAVSAAQPPKRTKFSQIFHILFYCIKLFSQIMLN